MKNYSIAVHGGAGTITRKSMTPKMEFLYKSGLQEAIEAGENILKKNRCSLDAVEAAVKCLEDNPLFNAGKGAVFTNEGTHELDASIMEGKNLSAGAVAGIRNIKNPVVLAKAVMQKSEHVFLAGTGAEKFAEKIGVEKMPDNYFYVEMRHQQLMDAIKENKILLDHNSTNQKKFGTVGAVALDKEGTLAAATSTGEMTNKKYGRVGDTPIIGSGTYANNNTCAISCTGHGEFFIRSVVAYDISCLIEYKNLSLQQACDFVVREKLVKIGGEGGLIAVDSAGNIEMPFNSEGMYRAFKKESGEIFVGIYKD